MFITEKSIGLEDFAAAFPPEHCGGTAIFVGRVRDHDRGKKVLRLFYECYRPMAEKEIGKIINSIRSETSVDEIRILHRIGWLEVGEIAVVISASAVHRQEAFQACKQAIDRIKENVPIWKKEIYADESVEWVSCSHE